MSEAENPLAGIPCRECGAEKLRIEMRLEAKPIGSFSISGQSMKVSATEWPWAVCDGCGAESRGKPL